MHVRTARPSDFPAYFELLEAVVDEGRWLGLEAPLARDRCEAAFQRLLDTPHATLLVAHAGAELLGAAGAESRLGVIELGMFVASGQRRRGVGRALLAAVVGWAAMQGAHKIVLDVWPHNSPARRLYRSLGFVEEGRFRRQHRRRSGELWDSIRMGLVLDETSPGSPWPDAS